MRHGFAKIPILLLGLALAALLAGCGGGTKTVTVASTPLPEQTTSTAAPRVSTTTTTSTTTTPTSATTAPRESGGASSPSTTRTAPAPAFTHQGTGGTGSGGTGGGAEGLSAAEAVVQAKGFTVSSATEYHPDQTLRVLIGSRSDSSEGNGQQAFFFVDGRYIGTDAKQPSAQIHVVSQGDTEIALAYALTGGGQATVRFQLNNGKLVPLGTIPSASARQ